MAKQTFSVGQVLSAANMTSLQQTAMGGGSTTAKTTSYVLVAADAGTTVAMNAAGATTITVNTGLFSAGDSVFIQNWGAGVTTITAGTATVTTAGSLALSQWEGGTLYFTSASAAIFYDFIQTGAASPLTTKGDLYTYSTSDARLPVGTNGYYLSADSTETTGLKWVAPATSSFVGCLTAVSGTQTISNATQTKCEFAGTDVYDTDAFHDPSTNNSRITIPTGKGGYYLIYGAWQWDNNATGRRIIYITKNNNIMYSTAGFSPANGPQYPNNYISVVLNLAAADYIELEVYQNSGGNLNRDSQTYFGVVKLG